MDWIIQNKEWVFGGIGLATVLIMTGIYLKKGEPHSQPVSGGRSKSHGRDHNGVVRHHDD
ncbi:hypothetical protein [Peribacillus sp. NPDC097295]|uniref:hypothetical protein n=1 Tax=Peribacillus sp. NPDC097295 TaxID=3364402 RepID=UPI00382C2816